MKKIFLHLLSSPNPLQRGIAWGKLMLLFFLLSCDPFLEKPQPEDTIPIGNAFNTIEDLELTLLGAYSVMKRLEIHLIFFPDYITANSTYVGGSNWDRQISAIPYSPFGGPIGQFWGENYLIINQCNLALQVLKEKANLGDAASRDRIRGEALFLRAVAYFGLVRVFSKPFGPDAASDLGVPIMEKPTTATSEITFPARATVQEVYDQVQEDLNQAVELLGEEFEAGRATRFAALAYRARVAFQQKNYELASQLALQVLNGPFSLNENPRDFFASEGSPEEIWTLVRTQQDPGALAFRSTALWVLFNDDLLQEGYGKIISPAQQTQLEANQLQAMDLRFTTLTDSAGSSVFSLKYTDPLGADDAPMLRLAEVILIRAEALVHTQGINAESLDLLNSIRRRALRVMDMDGNPTPNGTSFIEYSESDFTSPEELIVAIVRERRVEFVLEGNRFHDLMRLERPVSGLPFDADALRWPIPQREVDVNRNLVQNPGY